MAALADGSDVALVSDAGTPLVSDPGFRLVRAAHAADCRVVPVPGVSAAIAAISVAGLPCDRFVFEGFVPAKPGARRRRLRELASEPRSLVIYESVHRIAASIADMVEAFGAEREAFVGRELTKIHEQCVHGTLGTLAAGIADGSIRDKGEFVVVIAGTGDRPPSGIDAGLLLAELGAVLPARQAAGIAARVTGENKNALYRMLTGMRETR